MSLGELRRVHASAFTVNDDVLRIVDEVRRHAWTGLLSNNAVLLYEAFPESFPDLLMRFDPIIFSFESGYLKPHPKAFEAAIRFTGVQPDRIIFVDDTFDNVAAARAAGMHSLLFKTPEQLRRDLASHTDWVLHP